MGVDQGSRSVVDQVRIVRFSFRVVVDQTEATYMST